MGAILLGPGPLVKAITNLYDPESTYAVGDHCTRDGRIFKCTTAISTAEVWTPAHWTEIKVEDEIENTKSGLAYVEEGTTASQNIAEGSFVWWQGQMCVAEAAIAVGDTLSTTNLTIKSDGVLNALNSKIPSVIDNLTSTSTDDALSANQGNVIYNSMVRHTSYSVSPGVKNVVSLDSNSCCIAWFSNNAAWGVYIISTKLTSAGSVTPLYTPQGATLQMAGSSSLILQMSNNTSYDITLHIVRLK